jgi:signal transduction histidine kinase
VLTKTLPSFALHSLRNYNIYGRAKEKRVAYFAAPMSSLIEQSLQSQRHQDGREITGGDIEARLRGLTHDLIERIKELNCLYGISRLVEKENTSLDDILQGVVDLIPPAWQYPEVTCARISLRNRMFKTAIFRKARWKQADTITVNGKHAGRLEVYYLEERPSSYEGPFLKEERDLIHGIAERLGHIIESRMAENAVKKSYSREKRLHKKLQLEMQSRVDFTRQLVHELKTPLTSLLATSQLLFEETRTTRLEKLAGYVWEGANSLNRRIDELHDIIRGETGKLKLELKPLDIERLLRSLIEETKAFTHQYGMSINLAIKSDTLPAVYADEERVRQILFNLINNACKYASDGKKIILRATADTGAVTIEVKDFGPGIPGEKKRLLFRPGYQVSRPGESQGGLGLGLTLCKMLVELHGGAIRVESEVGKGSSFFFTLPCPDISGKQKTGPARKS